MPVSHTVALAQRHHSEAGRLPDPKKNRRPRPGCVEGEIHQFTGQRSKVDGGDLPLRRHAEQLLFPGGAMPKQPQSALRKMHGPGLGQTSVHLDGSTTAGTDPDCCRGSGHGRGEGPVQRDGGHLRRRPVTTERDETGVGA